MIFVININMYSKGYENSIQNENFIQIKMSHLKCVI